MPLGSRSRAPSGGMMADGRPLLSRLCHLHRGQYGVAPSPASFLGPEHIDSHEQGLDPPSPTCSLTLRRLAHRYAAHIRRATASRRCHRRRQPTNRPAAHLLTPPLGPSIVADADAVAVPPRASSQSSRRAPRGGAGCPTPLRRGRSRRLARAARRPHACRRAPMGLRIRRPPRSSRSVPPPHQAPTAMPMATPTATPTAPCTPPSARSSRRAPPRTPRTPAPRRRTRRRTMRTPHAAPRRAAR